VRKVESAALQLLAAITPSTHDVSIVQEHLGDAVRFDDANVDLVGITAMTIQARRAYEIADGYRSAGKTVVLGGIHPSVQPNEALQHADAVVVGEAEPVWSQVLADATTGHLRGLYRGKEYADLSQLPPYRRDLFPKRSSFSLGSVQAARGCPYDCSFCSATLFTGRKYRFRPVENVIAEIKAMGRRFIFFLDDNIFASEPYCRALFSELKKLDVIWVGQASLHLTAGNPDLLELAAKSGCFSLFVGIESLNESNLRATGSLAKNKVSTPEEIGRSIRVLHDHDIIVMAGVIFGFDDDDPDVFDRTREFLFDNRVGHGSFSALTPFPGTKLFEALHAQSRITTYDRRAIAGGDAPHGRELLQHAEDTSQALDESASSIHLSGHQLRLEALVQGGEPRAVFHSQWLLEGERQEVNRTRTRRIGGSKTAGIGGPRRGAEESGQRQTRDL
jgi:radical SAM superfamily enzyme YgiQ (UPF0313 family)